MRHVSSLLCATALLAGAHPTWAQPAPPPEPQPEPKPKPDPAAPSVDDRIKALETKLEDVQDKNEDLAGELADVKAQQVAARKQPANPGLLNPAITAFFNAAGRIDDHAVRTPDGVAINDRMFLRTAEFEFRAAVDPYSDAVAIVSFEDNAGQGFSADLEEVYVTLKRLPILESAPLGLKLKAGRYRAPIGVNNTTHLHDTPWTTRPLAVSRFLGTENGEFFESGFSAVGLDAQVILPEIIKGAVMELNADFVDGGQIGISANDHKRPGYLGHYNLFFTVHDTSDFNFGFSTYFEPGDLRTLLYVGDFFYKWKPLAAGEFHSVVLGGEAMYADRKFPTLADPMAIAETKPFAAYAFAQYQLSWHLYAGGRYDYAQDIVDKSLVTQVAAGYLSYYTSEFLRLRAGYEHRWSDVPAQDGINSFIAEVNVVFGSHPTEPYWVNR